MTTFRIEDAALALTEAELIYELRMFIDSCKRWPALHESGMAYADERIVAFAKERGITVVELPE